MVLLKMSVATGPERAEVLQMAQIFRGRTVDVSDTTLTVLVTGDNGKVSHYFISILKVSKYLF